MKKIRVETIDGDVDYLSLTPDISIDYMGFTVVFHRAIQEKFYPEYRLCDLEIALCDVLDE